MERGYSNYNVQGQLVLTQNVETPGAHIYNYVDGRLLNGETFYAVGT